MLEAKELTKNFGNTALFSNINLKLPKGTSLAIIGKSGVGKSTLLHILGTLENSDCGDLWIDGQKITGKNADSIRQKHIGFIFQNFNVLEDFSVLDNLKIAQQVRGEAFDKNLCMLFLNKVNLGHKATSVAKFLSGGEKQRLAIARALMHQPKIVFADEPTGSLDEAQAFEVQKLLLDQVKAGSTSLIIVTHDLDLAKKCDRILQLKDGTLKEFI